jgi:hypothetical protein
VRELGVPKQSSKGRKDLNTLAALIVELATAPESAKTNRPPTKVPVKKHRSKVAAKSD